ncbi:MAG: AbrB/MazE/SpoVT family DNA-binding domain-containing protein [Desulfovermiculus sp.]|nr:AbrB/MazE/SpoVT family DNA-binding domain-containing protein [Desulfovermiculus sp.]
MHATVTSKGQITLPKALREKLKLCAGDRVKFIIDGDGQGARLEVTNVPVTSLKGMLPQPSQPVSLEDMDRAVQEGAQNL